MLATFFLKEKLKLIWNLKYYKIPNKIPNKISMPVHK